MKSNLVLIFLIASAACSHNPTGPERLKSPRDYTWEIDTLSYPGSLQTIMFDIWGSSPKDVYVVGHNERGFGKMFHFDGKNWNPINLPLGLFSLEAIFGFSKEDVWAVGILSYENPNPPPNFLDSSLVVHYDGSTWQPASLTKQRGLTSIWGRSPEDIWAGGINGALYHYDGNFWRADSVPLFIPTDADPVYNFYAVTGNTAGDIFMLLFAPPPDGSERYYLFKRQDNAWAIADSMLYQYFSSIWLSPSGKLYASGSEVRLWDGTSWNTLSEGLETITYTIFGTSDTNLFAAGSSRIFHYNGLDWFEYENFQFNDVIFSGIWTDGNEVFIIGYTFNFPQNTIVLYGK